MSRALLPADPDLPPAAGRPALRVLAATGITRLDQVTSMTEAGLLRLQGVGPTAVGVLRQALSARGPSFAYRATR